jgi:hypothetical protein
LVLKLWFGFSRLLSLLGPAPFADGFSDLGLEFKWKLMWQTSGPSRLDYAVLTKLLKTAEELAGLNDRLAAIFPKSPRVQLETVTQTQAPGGLAETWFDLWEKERGAARHPRFGGAYQKSGAFLTSFAELQSNLADVCSDLLAYLYAKDSRQTTDGTLEKRFVCLVYTNFILSVLQRIRCLILSVVGLFVFTMLSFSFLPFSSLSSRSLEGFLMALVLLLILGVSGLVFGQMHRDKMLGYIAETDPGNLGGEFWLKFGTYALAPVVSLIAAQYPEIGNAILSLVQPALGALK